MKILIVSSYSGLKPTFLSRFLYTSFYPSITLGQLLSITPNRFEVNFIDERWGNVDLNWEGDIVAISTLTPSAEHAYEIADEFRKKGKTVVLGGYHPSALPREAKKHADSVVIGEAEISWPQLLKDFENKKLKSFYKSNPVKPDCIPYANRGIKYYSTTDIVQASRGCPYKCNFCSVQNVEGSIFRPRPIDEVIKEIESLNSNRFFFADSSMTIDSEYSKKLFKKMIGLNKKFSCYGNINILQKDEELLEIANKAGCEQWLIGFESINQDTLKMIGKKTNIVEDYASAIKKIKNYNMMIIGLFIFGFDNDKSDVFKLTLDTIYDLDLDRAGFAILTPFPGTRLFNDLDAQGRILTKEWSRYNLKNVVFKPNNMSVSELLDGRNMISKEFYSFSNSIKRTLRDENLNLNRFVKRIIIDNLFNRFYKIKY